MTREKQLCLPMWPGRSRADTKRIGPRCVGREKDSDWHCSPTDGGRGVTDLLGLLIEGSSMMNFKRIADVALGLALAASVVLLAVAGAETVNPP